MSSKIVVVVVVGCLTSVAAFAAFACGSDEDEPSGGGTSSSGTTTTGTSSGGTSGGGGTSGAPADAATPSSGDGGCTIPRVTNPNGNASGGPTGCAMPSDCTIRYVGDYCCPNEPQAMTNGAATFFDESLNGFSQECRDRCQTVRCGAKPDAAATCVSASCVLQ